MTAIAREPCPFNGTQNPSSLSHTPIIETATVPFLPGPGLNGEQLRKVTSTVHVTGEQTDEVKDALDRLLEPPRGQVGPISSLTCSTRTFFVGHVRRGNILPRCRRAYYYYWRILFDLLCTYVMQVRCMLQVARTTCCMYVHRPA